MVLVNTSLRILCFLALTLGGWSAFAALDPTGDVELKTEKPQVAPSEAERLSKVQACRDAEDIECMLDHMTVEEVTAEFGRELIEGSARRLRPGETPESFSVRIDVYLKNGTGQYLTLNSPAGSLGQVKVSGGKGGRSNLLKGECFVPHSSFRLVHSAKYNNAPMPNAVFFRGRKGSVDTGNVYAIHGTSAEGRLGTAASMGCIRVSRKNAATIRNIVESYGLESTMICVH